MYNGELMAHEVLEQVWQVFKEEAPFEPMREARLDQLFEGDRVGFARAIGRIEFGLQQRLCKDEHIQWLRTRTLEFVLWAIEHRLDTDDEFLLPEPYDEELLERVDELINLACADELGSGLHDRDIPTHDALYQRIHDSRLYRVYIECRKRWKKFFKQRLDI